MRTQLDRAARHFVRAARSHVRVAYAQLVPQTTPVGPFSLLLVIEATMAICGVIAYWLMGRAEPSFEERPDSPDPLPGSVRENAKLLS